MTKILEMNNICKSFGKVKVLKNVHLDVLKGEVHALMGENGAGKSTLMKILSGIYSRDDGIIKVDGKEVIYKEPKQAQNDGVVIVHQELNMMNHLTVAQNIFIGRETTKLPFIIDDNSLNDRAKNLFLKLGVNIDPKEVVGNITVGKQQMVEIAKAISMNAKIIVFDEPTATLTEKEIEELFKIINDLKKQNIGIVYISHRMSEIKKISDRITIMRDGEYINTVLTNEVTKDDIIKMMVGRVIYEDPKTNSLVEENAEVVLEVKNLTVKNAVKDISFKLHKGEILGIAGLMGAGRTEVARAIFGADKISSGEIVLNGKTVKINSTTDAVKNGIGYLSEDRRQFGLITSMNVQNNIGITYLDKFIKNGIIDDVKMQNTSNEYIEKLSIKCSSYKQIIKTLSGGNQQKVVIAKWLVRDSQILIFDEPTRGIDVGAKADIYALMNNLVKQGKSIIMISSELSEILRMSDRIIVMCEGKKTGTLDIQDATQEKIINYATMREEVTSNV